MTFPTCSRETELTRALKDGHWPQGCGPELRAHVDACAVCGDLVLVTRTFQKAMSDSDRIAPAGSPGLLWWRAQLRRRNAAAARVARPLTIAQIFAWVVTAFVSIIFVASQHRSGLRWASWWSELVPARVFHFLSIGSGRAESNPLLLICGFGMLAVLSAVVVYIASEKS
jgi:hypothetical protein